MQQGRKLAVTSFYVTGWTVVFLVAAEIILSAQSQPMFRVERTCVFIFSAMFSFAAVLSAVALFRLEKGRLRKVVTAELILIIFFLVGVLLPSMLPPKKSDGNAIISALRTISSAQELYNTRYETYGTLNQLENANMIDNVLAQATSPISAKSGYYFKLQVNSEAWCCTARPATFGLTGERNFMITNEGIIYWNEKENSSEFEKFLGG